MIAADHALAERIFTLVPINGLDARLQEQALAQGELLEFRRKKTVFEMGARDPYTFYLLDGELELQAEGASPVRMSAGDENARRALAQLQPRRYTAVAITPVSMFRIERAVLEHILADEQMLKDSSADMDVRELEDDEEDDSDWMSRLLSSELFTRLPHENIQRFFNELEPLDAPEGEVVVEQGTPGDFLYIIAEGRCAVVRRAPGGGQEVQLAVLKEGDSFGEESLISNSPRNASVRMLTDGMLMRLPKPAFEELVSNPTLKAVPWSEACKLAEGGAQWVDVRFADEHTADGIEGSINAPLNVLRLQASKLDRDTQYIVYCDSGARSSAGAFLLARLGFDTCYLAGGLERSPLAGGAQPAAIAPAAEPEATEQEDVAVANAAFEFEFTSGDEEDDGVADGAPDDAPGEQDAARLDEPDDSDEQQPAPAAAAAVEETAPVSEAPAPVAPAPSPASPTQPHPQMAQARAALATLKAERDRAAAYGNKAANAAREFKRRNEELNKVLLSERDRREQLDKELAAAKADSERQASMETSRLTGELEKAIKRIESVQAEREQVQQQAAAEVEKARAEVEEQKASLGAALKEKAEVDAMRVAAEVAFQDSLQAAQSEAKAAQELAAKAEKDLFEARERITEFETREKREADDLLSETSRLQASITQDQIKLEAERERLEAERAQLNTELEQLRSDREAADARDREARAELEKQLAQAQARDEALNQREVGLADLQESAQKEQQQLNETLARRETELTQSEQALSEEKAKWQETVDKAISDERARLESEQARFKQETESLSEERAQAIVEERIRELTDTHEEREAQMRGQVEAHVAKLLAEFDTRLEAVRSGYETRLNEQEAMLEDERRRLEAEIVRLREALADARQAPTTTEPAAAPIRGLVLPAEQPTDAAALGFELNEKAAAAIQDEAPDAPDSAAGFVPSGADLELDLDPQDIQPAAEAAATADASSDSTPARPEASTPELDLAIDESELGPATATRSAEPSSDVPLLELPGEDQAGDAESAARANEKKARIISSDQLADIRAKMQEKMRAAKAKAG